MNINKLVTLNTLLISVVAIIAVAGYLNIFVTIFFTAAIGINIGNLKYIELYFPRFLINLSGIVVIAATVLNFEISQMNTTLINTLVMLISLKLLEQKKYRDFMQITLMAVFILAASSLLNLSMIFVIYILSEVFLIILQLILLNVMANNSTGRINKRYFYKLLKPSLIILFCSIPAAVLLFLILPRTDYPMLDFLNNQQTAETGFSDSVRLGSIKTIQDNDKTAFIAEMKKIDSNYLYWRGAVFDTFQNNQWNSRHREKDESQMSSSNSYKNNTNYTIYLNPTNRKIMYTLNIPEKINYKKQFNHYKNRKEYISEKTIKSKTSYEGLSRLNKSFQTEPPDKDIYLQLPEIGKEIKIISEKLRGNTLSEAAENILHYLTSNEFEYTQKNLPVSEAPLKEFLTNLKKGNCEYFASAMGILLRLNGIPARLVGGYRGGYYDNSGYYTVLQSNAHVWVEAYIGKSWHTFDPTPADFEAYTDKSRLKFMKRYKLFFDKMSYYWNIFVINYDFSKQLKGLNKAKKIFGDWNLNISFLQKTIIFVFISIAFFTYIYTFRKKKKTVNQKFIDYFDKTLAEWSVTRSPGEGLLASAEKIKNKQISEKMQTIAKTYYNKAYGPTNISKQEIRLLLKELHNIRKKFNNT